MMITSHCWKIPEALAIREPDRVAKTVDYSCERHSLYQVIRF